MNKSEQINELAAALSKAQSEIKNPAFDSQNPHFRSKYASLASVCETVLPVLSKHGLSVSQHPSYAGGERPQAGCITILMHSSGQFLESELLLPLDKPNAHGAGSCITYAKRYALMGVVGVVGDEDDDANAATAQKPGMPTAAITPTTGAKEALSAEEIKKVDKLVSSVTDWLTEGAITDAVLTLENAGLLAEEKIYFWTQFDSTSRAAMKKEHTRLNKQSQDKQLATQA